MSLEHDGLVKLAEECGELIQAAMKRIALPKEGNIHWDGTNVKERLEDEMADVFAACFVVADKFDLDMNRIQQRKAYKKALFRYWDNGGTDTSIPWPKDGKFGVVDAWGTYRK